MKEFLWNLLGFMAGVAIGLILLTALVLCISCGHHDDPELEGIFDPPAEIVIFEQVWIWPGE